MQVKVKKIHPEAKIPSKANPTDSGFDLVAVSDPEVVWSKDSGKVLYIEYSTRITIEPPEGYYFELYPRSSISKYLLLLANSVGIIDNSYRGEIKLRFKPTHDYAHTIKDSIYKKGDKIGQLILKKLEPAELIEVEDLTNTNRGSGGFGSSGN